MAPEVILASKTANKSYGKKADVYSFDILMWHLWMLKPPHHEYLDFEGIQDSLLIDVSTKVQRPKLPWRCPRWLRDLMAACWEHAPEKRPDFAAIVVIAQLCYYSVKYIFWNH
jgi:hypothetical protein